MQSITSISPFQALIMFPTIHLLRYKIHTKREGLFTVTVMLKVMGGGRSAAMKRK